MIVSVNGEHSDLPDACSVRELLVRHGLGEAACAVEVNRRLVTKGEQDSVSLAEGDTVEIVTLVGGG